MEETLLSLDLVSPGIPPLKGFISFIQECKRGHNTLHANLAYQHACSYGIESDRFLGNFFIPLFVECDNLPHAQQLANRSSFLNDHSWTSLIEGYIERGEYSHAFELYQKMRTSSRPPIIPAFIRILSTCAQHSCLQLGIALHNDIEKRTDLDDLKIWTALINMYVKCGKLENAVILFNTISVRDVTMWTILVSGYVDHGHGDKAVSCMAQMENDGISPDPITLLYGVKASGIIGSLHNGQDIHVDIIKKGFEDDPFIRNSLVDMYSKCGALVDAEHVFNSLKVRNSITWNALIQGYIECEFRDRAFTYFQSMQEEGFSPDVATYLCILKACDDIVTIKQGYKIHTDILVRGWEGNLVIGSALIGMYAKCGLFDEAYSVLDGLPLRNTVSWNSLIAEYAEVGFGKEALLCFHNMQLDGILPDVITYTCCLKACGVIRDINMVEELHSKITTRGYMIDPYIGSTLIDTYIKCGSLTKAQEVFNMVSVRHVVTWTALMTGYAENDLPEEVLFLFEQMQADGISPNAVSFISTLKVCGNFGYIEVGKEMHAMIVMNGLETDVPLCNALINMYIKCGSLAEALMVFDRMTLQNVISWNTLISGLVDRGYGNQALGLFQQMQLDGVFPDSATFSSSLNACGSIGAIEMAQEIYCELSKEGFESEPYVGSSLVHMYAKCGLLSEALDVFENLPIKDVVVWTSMIAGYCERGLVTEGWEIFQQMQVYGMNPDVITWNALILGYARQEDIDEVLRYYAQLQEQGLLPASITFMNILKACGSTCALVTGKKFHALIYKSIRRNEDQGLHISLIDMYCKCGASFSAQQAFNEMEMNSLASLNTLLTGYAHLGECGNTLHLFESKRKEIYPDELSFLCVLNACSHEGAVYKGLRYFEEMSELYSMVPTDKHYNCIIDILGRAGQLREAMTIMKKMHFEADVATWSTMLSACQQWGDVELGRHVFECAVASNADHASTFIMMSNIYTQTRQLN